MAKTIRNLPQSLGTEFTTAEAQAAGITKPRLHRMNLERPLRAVHMQKSATSPQEHPYDVARAKHRRVALAYGKLLGKNSFFVNKTAALLWNLPVRIHNQDAISVATWHPHTPVRRSNVVGHKIRRPLATVTTLNGLQLTTPACTFAMLAQTLSTADAVALGDSILYQARLPGTEKLLRIPLATREELQTEIDLPMRRNRKKLLKIYGLLSTKSASPAESHLRLFFIEHNFAVPEEDVDVYDEYGNLLGCSEFVYSKLKIAFEYEGDHHRTSKAQWDRDIQKYHDYQRAGWIVVRVTAHLLYRHRTRLYNVICRVIADRDAMFR